MLKLRRVAAEALERRAVAGQQRRQQLKLPLLPQPRKAAVKDADAGALLHGGEQFFVSEPREKIVHVEDRARGGVRQRPETLHVTAL